MDNIADWLKQIIAVMIFAGFLDMLLPNMQLKGVTKLIMGLLIIFILIQPLTKIFKIPGELIWSLTEVSNSQTPEVSTEKLLQNGLRIREDWQALFKTEQHNNLKRKLQKMISAIEGIKVHQVDFDYDGNELKSIIIIVELQPDAVDDGLGRKKWSSEVRRLVSTVTELKEEQIEVVWYAGN